MQAVRRHLLVGRENGISKMSYLEWGNSDNPDVVVCVHGLTRNGRDFDVLARALAVNHRVICPDVVGRGESEWLREPMGYSLPCYVQDMLTLIARLDVNEISWVGTSMGGLIGMLLASLPGNPLKKLVLNDVGPILGGEAITRIATYVGKAPPMPDRQTAAAYIRTVSAQFGPHSDAEWDDLADIMMKPDGQGGWRLNYDPAISVPFAAAMQAGEMNLWSCYDQIVCPTLLIRGADSDLLSEAVAQEMALRGPRALRVDFAGVGHAPTLRHGDQVGAVVDFLR